MKATTQSKPSRVDLSAIGPETSTSRYISNLEGELCDLSNHAFVVASWMEDLFGSAGPIEKFPNNFYVNEEAVSATLFLVYDLKRRINQVKDEYFAAIEAGAISQIPAQPVRPDNAQPMFARDLEQAP